MGRRAKTAAQREMDGAIGRRIERARKAKRMSGTALAEALGVSRYALYLYESGQAACPLFRIVEIAAYLDVAPTALLGSAYKIQHSLAPEQNSATV